MKEDEEKRRREAAGSEEKRVTVQRREVSGLRNNKKMGYSETGRKGKTRDSMLTRQIR